jgi:hypothetical protein
MKLRLLSHARLVMPPFIIITSFILLYFIMEAFFLVVRANPRPGRVPPRDIPNPALFLAAVMYGVFRVVAFHPVFRDSYRSWLESTPWTYHKPLPLGPVELVWQDGLFIGALILLCATQRVPFAVQLLCTLLFAHIIFLALSFAMIGDWIFAYATAFTLGLAVWFWHRPIACVSALAGVYLIAYEGLKRAMAKFPWVEPKTLQISLVEIRFDSGARREPCGWPYDRIMGDVVGVRTIAWVDALLGSMLVSWWLFVLISFVPDVDDGNIVALIILVSATNLAAGARLLRYLRGYTSPLGFGARLLTFRWIIPGYDQVFIGPMCAVVAGPVTVAFLGSCSVPPAICYTAATGVVIFVALMTPPNLKRWRLTGQHRLVREMDQKSSFGEKPKYIRVK